MKKDLPLPKKFMLQVAQKFPDVWRDVRMVRDERGKSVPYWPDWCYLPIAAGIALASKHHCGDIPKAIFAEINPAALTAAATWRVSQGIYHFDDILYENLISQPFDGEIPGNILKKLPEWCVYIDSPGLKFHENILGFFVHLEKDMNDGREELRFVLLAETGENLPIVVHLGNTLEEGLRSVYLEACKNMPGYSTNFEFVDFSKELTPFLNLVLYLCAENADMDRPAHPSTRTRAMGAIDAPKKPRILDVGIRTKDPGRGYPDRSTDKKRTN